MGAILKVMNSIGSCMLYRHNEARGYVVDGCICFRRPEIQIQLRYTSILMPCQHAVIRCPVNGNSSLADIFDQLCYVRGDSCMGGSSVWHWMKHLSDCKRNIADLSHSNRPGATTMECSKQKVYELITE